MITATATEIQNNFGQYLNRVMNNEEIIVTKNGKPVGRFIPNDTAKSYLSDSLVGIISDKYDFEEEKERYLREKYESAH